MYITTNYLSRIGSGNDSWPHLNFANTDNLYSYDVIDDLISGSACTELHSLPLVSFVYIDESHDMCTKWPPMA